MIKYDYEITVNGNQAKLNKDIYLFRGNKNVHYYFAVKNASFNFKGSTDLIEKTNAINAAVTVIKPNNVEVASAIAKVENGKIHLKVTEDLIDEEVEVGDFDLVFDLFDDTDGAVTIPKVIGQFHVLERPCTTPISELVATNTTNEVDQALTDYAIVTYAEPVASTNADGTFAKKTWVAKEKITTAELNRMEEGISDVSSQFKEIAKKIDDIGSGGSGLNLRNIQNGEIFVLKTSTTKIPVTGVSLNKSTLNLNVGDTEILIPTITPDNATSSTIIWSCDNNNAKVEGGVVTALKAGTCVITATSDDTTNGTIKATCSVICSNVNVQNVSISGDTEVTTSTSIMLSANITPGNATNKNVTWSKNNDNINITPNGLQCDVTGVSEGSSVITVTTEDGNKTATYNITVSTGIVAPSDCDIDSTNLQGYYRMNHLNEDNTKILDISGNGRDMTIYPNNMTIGEGYYTKVNQYQHLNNSQYSAHDSGGDQFIDVFNDNNVTLFLTVNIPSSVGGAEALFGLEAINGFGGCTFQGGVIIYNQNQATFNQVQSSTKSCLGSLCTLAFKHDAVNNKDYIYKDGVLLNEQDSKVDLVNGKVAEYLGIGRGYTASYGNIKFYNWAIYNAVLNNDKIQEISTTLLTNAGGGN